MKRAVIIGMTLIFLFQGFMGIQFPEERSDDENSAKLSGPNVISENECGTRNDEGLVAQWHFDEGSGDHVGDSSGNGNHGTMNNMNNDDWVRGVRGKALEFDGVNDYVDLGDLINEPSSDFTVEAWIKSNDLGNGKGIFGGGINQIQWLIGNGGSQLHNLYNCPASSDAPIPGKWYFISVTRNGNIIQPYTNGEINGQPCQAGIRHNFDDDNYYIGAYHDPTTFCVFNGTVDEFSIYDRALTPDEITAHYNRIINGSFNIEQDSFGGSWFDDFDDDSGIEGGLGVRRLEADEHTVALWHFDEGTGNQARDASGNGNHGTLTDMEQGDWVEGKFRKGLEFDGTNDYVEVQDNEIFNTTVEFSYEVWFKTNNQDSNHHYLLSKYKYTQPCWGMSVVNGQLHVLVRTGTSTYEQLNIAPVADGNWHYATVTRSGINVNVYIDGVLTVNGTIDNGNINPFGYNLFIGAGKHGQAQQTDEFFQGMIDELRISNITRTHQEIKQNYEGGLSLRNGDIEIAKYKIEPVFGCVGYWSFDEGIGNNAFDGSGNGNDGKLFNMQDNDWISGIRGTALIFDGLNDYVLCGNDISMTIDHDITVEAWIKTDKIDTTDHIVYKYDGANESGWALYQQFGDLHFGGRDGSGSFREVSTSGSGIFDGKWHYLVGQRVGSIWKIYVDGDERNSVDVGTTGSIGADGWPVSIGWNVMDTSIPVRNFDGSIDEVAIYNRVLTASEIQQHYNRTLYRTNTSITSTQITIPESMEWSILSIAKAEPANTYINISVLNAEDNSTIPGFDNLTNRSIDLTSLNDLGITSIRLKAYFSGNGSATPSLDSWGVEWTAENAWRDSFTGDSKVGYPYGVDEYTVGYWKFDEGCGNVARDLSGNRNDGVIYGVNWTNGVRGSALELDGNGDYVDITNVLINNLTSTSTGAIEAWIYFENATPSSENTIVCFGDTDANNVLYLHMSEVLDDNKIIAYLTEAGNPQWKLRVDNIEISDKTWFHIALNQDGTEPAIYIDGIKPDQTFVQAYDVDRTAWFADINSLDNGRIGKYESANLNRNFLNGMIDEVRISNVARTPDEIHQAYRAGIAIHGGQVQLGDNELMVDGNTSALWHFNEGEGNVLHDSSGNGNDGVIHGANWTEGVMSSGLEFDGVDDYVDVNFNPKYSTTDDFSWEAWMKVSDISNNPAIITARDETGSSSDMIRLQVWNDGRIYFVMRDENGDSSNNFWTTKTVDDGKWHHIVLVRNTIADKFYIFIDGYQYASVTDPSTGAICSTEGGLNIGYDPYLGGCDYFNGIIDEVAIYDRALTPTEILAHSHLYRPNATLCSVPIPLPSNNTWSTFHCSRSVPDNTYLNISVHDAMTNKPLLTNTNRTGELHIDLSEIDSLIHPSVYLEAYFQSNRTETPLLYDWAVNWTSGTGILHPPELIRNVPEEISIPEDTPTENITDLADHFHDRYSAITPPVFALESISDSVNITLSLNGSKLDITNLTENWTGIVHVVANCTNMHGLSTLSNEFIINITPVNDPPAWNSTPPKITVRQGTSAISEYSLDEFVVDAEGDSCGFSVSSPDENVSATLDGGNHITVEHTGGVVGDHTILATVFQSDNFSLYSNVSIPVLVMENIVPRARLLSPRNGNTVPSTTVTLSWLVLDNDTSPENITCDIFFGNTSAPAIYQSDWNLTEFEVSGLSDGETYYWTIVTRDEFRNGTCLNGTWNFTVSTSAPIPKVTYKAPLDNSIINTTSVILEWSFQNPLEEVLNFNVYLADAADNLSMIATTKNVTYQLTNLTDNTTYYWKVIPWSENITGISLSGVWNFTVRKGFVRSYGLEIRSSLQYFNITRGTIGRFDLNITNTGNQPERVLLSIESWLLTSVVLNVSELNIVHGDVGYFQLMISIDESTVISDYDVVIIASIDRSGGAKYTITYPISVHVISEDTGIAEAPEPGEKGIGELLKSYWEVPLVIISGIIAIFGYFQFKRRKNKFQNLRREIDRVYSDLSDVRGAITDLEKVSSKLTEYMDKEKITDNQYLILDRKINDYVMELRGTARMGDLKGAVETLPPAIRSKVEGILKDGKVTLDEVHDLENVLWEGDISEDQRTAIGNFAVQWLKEDTGEVVDWGAEKDEGEVTVEADIVHVPIGPTIGKSFMDIVKETSPPPQPVPPAPVPQQAGGQQMPVSQPGVIMPYAVRGREMGVTPVTVGQGGQEMQVHLPEPGMPAIPPAPGVAMPAPAIAPAEETKALPQGDILATVSGILDGVGTVPQAPPGTPQAPPMPIPEPEALTEGVKQPPLAALPPPQTPPPLPPPGD